MQKKVVAFALLALFAVLAIGGVFFYTQQRKVATSVQPNSETPIASPSSGSSTQLAATASPLLPFSDSITGIIVADASQKLTYTPADNHTALPETTDSIKVVVVLDPRSPATEAVLKMTYIADDSILGPVTSEVKTVDGKKLAGFLLTKPTTGWPNGPYSLLVTLSTGESKETQLIIQ